MGKYHTSGDDDSGSDMSSLGSEYMDGWDSSSSSGMESGVDYSGEGSMDLCTETTCAEDSSGMEEMGHKSDEAANLNSTGLPPSIGVDETERLV